MKIQFRRAEATNYPTVDEIVKAGMPRAQAERELERLKAQDVYLSDCGQYQVNVQFIAQQAGWPAMQWLSIKRVDRECIHDFRVLQAIKNGIVGEEVEAVELYPAESRLVDSANQYHLFALTSSDVRFPFGYGERLVTEEPLGKSKQRPFKEKT